MKGIAGLTLKILFVLLLFVAVFSFAMFQGGFVSWFLFYSFLPIILYQFFFLLYPISNWRVQRYIKKSSLEASDKAEVEIIINRKLPFPIYYCIIEEILPSSLHRQDTKREKYQNMENQDIVAQRRIVRKSVFPWFRKTISAHYQLELLPRGDHSLHAIRVRCGDFFGFVKKQHIFAVETPLLVYPSKRQVIMNEKASSMDGGASVAYNRKTKSSNVVTGVREYAPGDRYSWIDWKTTARRNTVMTKEFEQEKSSDVLVIFDSVLYPEWNTLAFEGSVELTASLIDTLQKADSPFSFLSLGKDKRFFPFQAGPVKKRGISHHLAIVQPGENDAFSRLLKQELSKLPNGTIVVAITTKLDSDLKYTLEKTRGKSKRVILLLVKPQASITNEEQTIIRELSGNGIIVNLITEKKLVQNKFEVKT